MVAGLFMVPHAPIIIPEIGGYDSEKVKKTKEALEKVGQEIAKLLPDVIVFITPHGYMAHNENTLIQTERIKGDLGGFGHSEIFFDCPYDKELSENIIQKATEKKLPTKVINEESLMFSGQKLTLDHGVMVPLFFIQKELGQSIPLVVINYGLLSYASLHEYGSAVRQAIESLKRKAVIVASGDLSHRLLPSSPAGYSERGQEFDERLCGLVREGDLKALLTIESDLIEEAGECGLRSFVILAGMVNSKKTKTEIMSYEGPFGVGYLVAKISEN